MEISENLKFGEIPLHMAQEKIPDGFVEIDDSSQRAFYVPSHINVYHNRGDKKGEPLQGLFKLLPDSGTAIEVSAFIHRTASLGKRAVVGAASKIYNNSVIEDDVFIEDRTHIYQNVTIGKKARIGRKTVIHDNAEVRTKAIIGSRCHIGHSAVVKRDARILPKTSVPEGAVVMSTKTSLKRR